MTEYITQEFACESSLTAILSTQASQPARRIASPCAPGIVRLGQTARICLSAWLTALAVVWQTRRLLRSWEESMPRWRRQR